MITTPIKFGYTYPYSIEELRQRKDELQWNYVCALKTFTQDEIRQFQDYVIWPLIAQQKNLSESFIREFKDYIDINDIAHYREMNLDFIREMYSEHDLKLLNVITYGNLEWGSKKREEIINEYKKQFK